VYKQPANQWAVSRATWIQSTFRHPIPLQCRTTSPSGFTVSILNTERARSRWTLVLTWVFRFKPVKTGKSLLHALFVIQLLQFQAGMNLQERNLQHVLAYNSLTTQTTFGPLFSSHLLCTLHDQPVLSYMM
jgi:hypothetical protein